MRQIVSLIKDNQAHFALVDDESGDMIPFADLLIPDPERFGLHESAVLGTNLISALGLNGSKRPKAHIPRVGDIVPGLGPDQEVETAALPPAKHETAKQRRNRLAREKYERDKQKAQRRPDTSKGGAQRYVSIDEILAVVANYPEGIRVRDLAERLWRQTDGKGTDTEYPGWFYTAISNRFTKARLDLKDKGIPLPFREEDRPVPDKNGRDNGQTGRYIMPLAPPERPTMPAADSPLFNHISHPVATGSETPASP